MPVNVVPIGGGLPDLPKTTKVPKRIDALVARIYARDRAYLRSHPNEDFYIRPAVPGEFWPWSPVGVVVTRVARINAGWHSREPLRLPTETEGPGYRPVKKFLPLDGNQA